MSATEDSELLEIEVGPHRRRIRRRRYRPICACDPARRTLVAPPPPKLIPKGNYHIHRERLPHAIGSPEFQRQDALLRQAVESMRAEAVQELSAPKLRQPCRKALQSLQEHWTGLVRFVDDPRIPMDNNASERAGRGPAVARKNFYGSGSLWSGRLAAAMFSLFATLAHWKLNPRLWLAWYLENCAEAGGKTPEDIQPFLPWNLSAERRAALAMRTTTPAAADTS
jgi:transposase